MIVTYPTLFECDNIPESHHRGQLVRDVSPNCDRDRTAGIITDGNVKSIFRVSRLHFDLGCARDFKYRPNYINGAVGGQIFDCRNRGKCKSIIQDLCIFSALLDLSFFAKREAKVILYARKLLVRHLNFSISDNVNLVLLNFVEPLLSCVIEHRRLNHGALFVDHVDVHYLTGAFSVFILFEWRFLHNTRLDTPICCKLVQSLDRYIVITIILGLNAC